MLLSYVFVEFTSESSRKRLIYAFDASQDISCSFVTKTIDATKRLKERPLVWQWFADQKVQRRLGPVVEASKQIMSSGCDVQDRTTNV